VTANGTTNGSPVPRSGYASLKVTIINAPPVITSISGPGPIGLSGSGVNAMVTTNFTDVGSQDTHTCTYTWSDVSAPTVVSASGTGNGSCSATHTYTAVGVYEVDVAVMDDDTGTASGRFQYVVVYDPNAGFVTGGGWIDSPSGAYTANTSLTGRANFGFTSQYKKGATAPTGQTEFQFQVASFNFHSDSYQWLVVSGPKAQYKGTGSINGVSGYGFLLTATDGSISGGGGVDKFRIKIWDSSGNTVYDNVPTATSDDINNANPEAISGGSIVIHK
jgi:hypothetical protein